MADDDGTVVGTSSGSGSGTGLGSGSGGSLLPDFQTLRNTPPDGRTLDQLQQTSENAAYGTVMQPFDDDTVKTPVSMLSLTEASNGGWAGEVVVVPPPSLTASVEDAFFGAYIMDIVPGHGVLLRLLYSPAPGRSTVLRSWPSAVLGVQTIRGTEEYTPAYRAQLGDPLTLLANQRIWGVYVDESIGKIVGGAIGLAMGGTGDATLTPATGSALPAIEIEESVRSDLTSIPLTIAAGAEFGDWLQDLLAELGARIAMRVEGQKVVVEVTDAKPDADAVAMTLAAQDASVSETEAALVAMGAGAREDKRAALLDNRVVGDAERSHSRGSIGQVMDAMHIESDEAWLRAGFEQDNDFLGASTATIMSLQSKLAPGVRIELDRPVFGTDEWQVAVSLHRFTTGLYRNLATLQKDGVPWRGEGGRLEDGVTVTAIVDDGAADAGEPVERDRLGRIPVRLSFLKGGEGENMVVDTDDANTAPAWTGATVSLPLLETMGGGGAHGFVSAHRQGDPCRVVIHSPLNAEIAGFAYRQDGRVGADLVDSTAGLVVRHQTDGFSGLVFRPDEDLDPELQGGSGSGSV